MDRSYPISTLRLSRGLGRPYRDEPFEGSPMFPLSHGSNPQTIHFLRDFPRFVGITGSPSSIKSSGKQPAPGKECSMFFGVTSSWGPSHHPLQKLGFSMKYHEIIHPASLDSLGYPVSPISGKPGDRRGGSLGAAPRTLIRKCLTDHGSCPKKMVVNQPLNGEMNGRCS